MQAPLQTMLADMAVSVSDLKKSPSAVMSRAGGAPVAVLDHNRVMGYMVPPDLFETMMEAVEDAEPAGIVEARADERPVKVSLDALRAPVLPSALKEWEKLGSPIRDQFRKTLSERLQVPRVEPDKLRVADLKDCYKIKLRSSGYRLVYRVDDAAIAVTVVTVGKRERSAAYRSAEERRQGRSPGTGGPRRER